MLTCSLEELGVMSSRITKTCLAALLTVGSAILGSSTALSAEAQWLIDFEQAKALAKKEGKDLLMDFTGSDWCGFCIQLDKNVFSKEIFAEKIPEKFILLKIDDRRDKSKQSEAEKKMVRELTKKYGISGFPTILLCDAEGRPYASFVGYGGTPADKYVSDLLSKQKVREKRDALLAKAEAASGAEKAKLLDEVLQMVDEDLRLSVYGDLVDQIIEADAQNEAGLKEKYVTMRRDADFEKKLEEVIGGLTAAEQVPEAVTKLKGMVEAAEKEGVSPDARQKGLFMIAQLQFSTDKAASKATLQEALKMAPEGPLAGQIKMVLERFFSEKKPADQGNDGSNR